MPSSNPTLLLCSKHCFSFCDLVKQNFVSRKCDTAHSVCIVPSFGALENVGRRGSEVWNGYVINFVTFRSC